MPFLNDRVLDFGLTVLDTEATHIYATSAEASTFAAATGSLALGNKNFGAGGCFTAPSARTPSGRKAASVPITDGTITATGTATHYAVVDSVNSRLLAAGPLAGAVAVTIGNSFTLASFDVGIPGPA